MIHIIFFRHQYLPFFIGVSFIRVVMLMMSLPPDVGNGLRAGAISAFGLGIFTHDGILGVDILAIYLPFLAVLALSLNALAVGAPLVPGFLGFSFDPAAIRACLAWILA